MRQALGFILVFCFIVIAVPKTVLHDHDHDHLELTDGDSFSQDHEDCFSCDFDYSSLSANVVSNYNPKVLFLENYLNDRLLEGISAYSQDIKSRGPPCSNFIS